MKPQMRILFQVIMVLVLAVFNQACKQDGVKSSKSQTTSESTSSTKSKHRCEHVPDWSNWHSHLDCEEESPAQTDYCSAFTDGYNGRGGSSYFGEGYTRASCEQACASVLADVISYSVDYGYCRFGAEDIIWDTFSPDFGSYVANFNSGGSGGSGDGGSSGSSSVGLQFCTARTDGYASEWLMGIFDNRASCEAACQDLRSQIASNNSYIEFQNQAYGYSLPMNNGYCHFGDEVVWSYGTTPYAPVSDSGSGAGSGDGDYSGDGGGY